MTSLPIVTVKHSLMRTHRNVFTDLLKARPAGSNESMYGRIASQVMNRARLWHTKNPIYTLVQAHLIVRIVAGIVCAKYRVHVSTKLCVAEAIGEILLDSNSVTLFLSYYHCPDVPQMHIAVGANKHLHQAFFAPPFRRSPPPARPF
jgi:hypothetical protein